MKLVASEPFTYILLHLFTYITFSLFGDFLITSNLCDIITFLIFEVEG